MITQIIDINMMYKNEKIYLAGNRGKMGSGIAHKFEVVSSCFQKEKSDYVFLTKVVNSK